MEDLSRTRKLLDQANDLIKQQRERIVVLEERQEVLQTQLVSFRLVVILPLERYSLATPLL